MIKILKNTKTEEITKLLDTVIQSKESQLTEADKMLLVQIKSMVGQGKNNMDMLIKALDLFKLFFKAEEFFDKDD